jgi:hypothetical protein
MLTLASEHKDCFYAKRRKDPLNKNAEMEGEIEGAV